MAPWGVLFATHLTLFQKVLLWLWSEDPPYDIDKLYFLSINSTHILQGKNQIYFVTVVTLDDTVKVTSETFIVIGGVDL